MHFLLELLQNADDCVFASSVVPTVKFTYKDHSNGRAATLRIDCNEVGFRSTNVEAICSLSESSKPKAENPSSTTGEKGIGFKSVFDVANVVWIRSGHYSFKFVNDEAKALSMIAPYWASFPEDDHRLSRHTSLLLELSPKCDRRLLLERLKSIDPDTALFLRNLKVIKIEVNKEGRKPWKTSIKRLDDSQPEGDMFIRTIEKGKKSVSYYLFRSNIDKDSLGFDVQRQGINDPHILLAFPKQSDSLELDESPRARQVYAFLPVKDHGFKFALQADFVLVTSREAIEDCPWNVSLISPIPQAFLGAVNEFVRRGITSWTPYIPLGPLDGKVFQDTSATMMDLLSQSPILESDEGEHLAPSEVVVVPRRFRDRSSNSPLLPPGARRTKYLSDKYETDGINFDLSIVGVGTLSMSEFLADLETFLSTDQATFQEMELAWHAQVANILLSLFTDSEEETTELYRDKISKWNLIPVLTSGREGDSFHDCSWVASTSGIIFLPAKLHNALSLPGGLNLFEVHGDVKKYSAWIDLLRLLKAEPYDIPRICDIIVSYHKNPRFLPTDLSPRDVVSHAVFLKRARWRPPERTQGNMWFAASDESCHRGSSLYIRADIIAASGLPFTAASVFEKHTEQCPVHFLHNEYESQLSQYDEKAESWVVWLARCFNLTIIPRLTLEHNPGTGKFTLSPEFRFLVHNDPEMVLLLLRQFWHRYREWIVATSSVDPDSPRRDRGSRERMRALFSSMVVPCVGQEKTLLRNTVLPRESVLRGIELLTPLPGETLEGKRMVGEDIPEAGPSKKTETAPSPHVQNSTLHERLPTGPKSSAEPSTKPKTAKSSLRNLLGNIFPCGARREDVTWPETVTEEPVAAPSKVPLRLDEDIPWPASSVGNAYDTTGESEALNEDTTRMPTMEITLKSRPLLLVADPENGSWDFLAHLGVITNFRTNELLTRLRQLKDSNSATLEAATSFYEHLENTIKANDIESVRETFVTDELVLIPDPGAPSGICWLSLDACVWDGPAFLRKTPRLKKIYPSRIELFLYKFKCQPSDLTTLIQEARGITNADGPQRIAQIFEAISRHRDLEKSAVYTLKELSILPIAKGIGSAGPYTLRAAVDSEGWFIPDDDRASRAFANTLDFLAFSSASCVACKPFFKSLNLQHKLLSVAAKEGLVSKGEIRRAISYDRWFKKRTRFILALLPVTVPNRGKISLCVQNIKVILVNELITQWKIHENDLSTVQYQSMTSIPVALLDTDGEELQIWLTMKDSLATTDHLMNVALELSQFCGISKPEHSVLLTRILTEPNHNKIENQLRSLDIPFEPADSEDSIDIDELPMINELPNSDILVPSSAGPISTAQEIRNTDRSPIVGIQATEKNQNKHETQHGTDTDEIHHASDLRLHKDNGTQGPDEVTGETQGLNNTRTGLQRTASDQKQPNQETRLRADTKNISNEEEWNVDGDSLGTDDFYRMQRLIVPDIVVSEAQSELRADSPSSATRSESETEETDAHRTVPSHDTATRELIAQGDDTTNEAQGKSIEIPEHPASFGLRQNLVSLFDYSYESESSDDTEDTETDLEPRGRSLPLQYSLPNSQAPSTHILPSRDHSADRPRSRSKAPRSRSRGDSDFVNLNKGWITVPRPMTIFSGEDTKETRYFGELYVSRFLQIFLKDGYEPNKHWTSSLRVRNGHTEYKAEAGVKDNSTFTIPETDGELTKALIDAKQIPAESLDNDKSVTFHLQVWATNDMLNSRFVVSDTQHKKLRRMSLVEKAERAKDIYMLVRVYQIQKDPGIHIYVDPWKLQLKGDIVLETESSYSASVPLTAEPFLQFTSSSFPQKKHQIYKDLDVGSHKIRLLRLDLLKDGDNDDDDQPLRGTLRVVDPDNDITERFWAISYVWGPTPDGPSPSTFTTEQGTVPISESLAACLKCLRRRRVPALLWADALCINQDDPVEKASQVRRMGSLYRRAERVIVWLGISGHSSESSPALECMAAAHEPLCHAGGRCHTREGNSQRNPNASKVDRASWKVVDEFLGRSWFTRSWIVQEVAVCPNTTIVCGGSEMRWDCFIESLLECSHGLSENGELIDGHGRYLASSRPALALHRLRERYQDGAKFDFLRLLDMFSYTRSSWPRDKLFALQNLARDVDTEDAAFRPDYDSLEEDVLERYAQGFVQKFKRLDLLYRAGAGKAASFCSWVPDFLNDQRRERTISTWDAAGRENGFYAGRHVPSKIEVRASDELDSKRGQILAVKGYIIDEVDDCFDLHLSVGMRVTFAEALESMRHYISYLDDYPGLEQGATTKPKTTANSWAEELMIKCLIGDARGPCTLSRLSSTYAADETASQDQPTTSKRWDDHDWEEILKLDLGQNARKFKQEKTEETHRKIMAFWETAVAFTDRIPQAVFSTTKKKYAGIIPGAARRGDKIFIADGAKVPFIISPSTHSTAYYRLVGEAYIHGIMYYPPSVSREVEKKEVEEVCLI